MNKRMKDLQHKLDVTFGVDVYQVSQNHFGEYRKVVEVHMPNLSETNITHVNSIKELEAFVNGFVQGAYIGDKQWHNKRLKTKLAFQKR